MSDLERPAALWASGVTVADLLDEDGQLDPAKVTEAAEAAQQTLGAAPARRTPKPDMTQGAHGSEPQPNDPLVAALSPKQ